MIDLVKANKAFDNYVRKFDNCNAWISGKYEHTYRVCKQSLEISKSINLDEEDTNLAYLIALLHDIGRFEQLRQYNSFNDATSIDHALLGCHILFDEGLINEFLCDRSYDEIIRKAIFNHNKYGITEDMSERELMHSKIIRDSDKIDIISMSIDSSTIACLDDNDEKITPLVEEDFFNHRVVKHEHKKVKNDAIIIRLAFIYDLNFDYTINYFINHEFIDSLFKRVEHKNIFRPYIDYAKQYLESSKVKKMNNKIITIA